MFNLQRWSQLPRAVRVGANVTLGAFSAALILALILDYYTDLAIVAAVSITIIRLVFWVTETLASHLTMR